jgi:hypothetical protein
MLDEQTIKCNSVKSKHPAQFDRDHGVGGAEVVSFKLLVLYLIGNNSLYTMDRESIEPRAYWVMAKKRMSTPIMSKHQV